MQNRLPQLLTCLLLLPVMACKKNNQPVPFSAAGFWRGHAFVYHTAVLNRPNGTSRFYYIIPGNDTSKATFRAEGTYSLANEKLLARYYINSADTIFLETYALSPENITGILISSATGEAIPFEFRKQP